MTEYYKIIGRAPPKPFKKRLHELLAHIMLYGHVAVSCWCAIYVAIHTANVVNGLLALVLVGLFGIVIFPSLAIAEGVAFAVVVCCVYVVLFLLLIFLMVTESKPTKKEQSQNRQLQLRKKEFEAKYPRAPEIKQEYIQIRAEHGKTKRVVKDSLKATSIKEINADLLLGKISKEEHTKLIDCYQVLQYRAEHEAFLDEVTEEICSHLKEELQGFITEFEQDK